ncbi:MAG: hypothetical protein ACNA76_04490 [Anaerosomatales bacterium]
MTIARVPEFCVEHERTNVTPASPQSPKPSAALSQRATWIIIAVSFVVIVGLVGLVFWAITSSGGGSSAPRPGFERYEGAWASAMAKASVEATFPAGPVDVTAVRVTGSQPLEATFTGEEMAALLSVYRYRATVAGQSFALRDVSVEFPEPGVTALRLTLDTGGSSYKARAEAPLAYERGSITSPGLTSLRVEGFSVGGSRRQQAGDGILDYLNEFLDATPGLNVDEARITADGLEVRGTVPESIEHPDPIDS